MASLPGESAAGERAPSLAPLAVVAGAGDLPRLIVEQCRAVGRPFHVLCLEGQGNPADFPEVPLTPLRLGAIMGKGLDILRRHGLREVVMAGAVRRPTLSSLRPDARTLAFLMRTGAMALGDDGLLRALVRDLEAREGVRVITAQEALGQSAIHPPGPLGKHAPDAMAQRDIARGLSVLRAVSAVDVGQAVVVQDGLVLGIEAIEGTERLLARCGEEKRSGPGGVLVKMRKLGQEERVDLPVIGLRTVEQAKVSGLRGIAFDAGGMILLDRPAMVSAADAAGLFLHAVESQGGS